MLTLLYHAKEGKRHKAAVKKVVFSQEECLNDDYAYFATSTIPIRNDIKTVLTSSPEVFEINRGSNILLFPEMPELEDGSIVRLDDKLLRIINRPSANNHSLFITYNCNHYCLMCSEPPKTENDSYFIDDNLKVIELLNKDLPVIGITGGEPTLAGKNYIKIIKKIRECLPDTYIRVLTNGKSYKNEKFTQEIADIAGKYYISEIPLYHSNYAHHDYIVQSKNAFNETVEGIYTCAKHQLYVEIRIVITLQNYKDLSNLIYFIYKNMPFVTNIALMSLEYTGFAKLNFDTIHVSPLEYKNELVEAIKLCKQYGLPVTIFNLPLCLIDESIREHARQTISDWKNEYSDGCEQCAEKESCSGMFTTTKPIYEELLTPIIKNSVQ